MQLQLDNYMEISLNEVVAVLGGWSVFFGGLCAWLGKVLSGRIFEAEKASHLAEIERLRSNLELERGRITRNNEAEFQLYSEVFSSLMDVKSIGDELWESASEKISTTFRVY